MPRRAACRRCVCLDSSFRWDLRGIDQRVQSRILSCLWGRRWKERSAIEHVATDKCSVLTVDRTVIISIDAVGVRWDRSFAARDLQGERDVRDIVLAVGIHVATNKHALPRFRWWGRITTLAERLFASGSTNASRPSEQSHWRCCADRAVGSTRRDFWSDEGRGATS